MNKAYPIIVLICFLVTSIIGPNHVYAQEFRLPAPGVMVGLSPEYNPPVLKGIKVYPDNPFSFDFILDKGDSLQEQTPEWLKQESTKLIKYFLASLTIPETDLWVNLSPYEKDRIIPNSFGLTEMGRDLLAEDYMLKQITASLIYPEDEIGKKFWKRIYEEAQKKFGTADVPVNTFNKVWIVPEKAVVYENAKAGTAYVVESKLKVMLDQDYLSMQKHVSSVSNDAQLTTSKQLGLLGANIVREIVIPALTKEVNEGKNFARLRQVYQSLILATWYKNKIKDSILNRIYINKNKVVGINIDDPQEKQKIYERYLQAFKKGAYNYIKEEIDPITQQTVPRKYFSGGASFTNMAMISALDIVETLDVPRAQEGAGRLEVIKLGIDPAMDAFVKAGTEGNERYEFLYNRPGKYRHWEIVALPYVMMMNLRDEELNIVEAIMRENKRIALRNPELSRMIGNNVSELRGQVQVNDFGPMTMEPMPGIEEVNIDKLIGNLRNPSALMRRDAVRAIGWFLASQDYDHESAQEMRQFVTDQEHGFGLTSKQISEGMSLIFAFGQEGHMEALESFLAVMRNSTLGQRTFLAQIAFDYFRANAFKDFVEVLSQHPRSNFNDLKLALQGKLLNLLDTANNGYSNRGWQMIDQLLINANRYPSIRQNILEKIVVTFKLLRQGIGKDTGFRQGNTHILYILTKFPQLKNNLMRMLTDETIPLYTRRYLAQSFPAIGSNDLIEGLRKAALILVKAATGRGSDYLEGAVGTIRWRIHNNPSNQDVAVVEAYKLFVQSDGTQGREKLTGLGYKVNDTDIVSAERKIETLQACDGLLEKLKDVYGGESTANMDTLWEEASFVIGPSESDRLKQELGEITGKSEYGLDDLERVITIREKLNDFIRHGNRNGIFPVLRLDYRMEVFIYRIYNSLPMDQRQSPELLLLMLRNTALNGYGQEVIGALTAELKEILAHHSITDLRLYEITQRINRLIKRATVEVIGNYQTVAREAAGALGAGVNERPEVENFSADLFRSDTIYLLSLLVNDMEKTLRQKLGMTDWQVVAEGQATGRLHYVEHLSQLNEVKPGEILAIDHLPSESPILSQVAGIIVFEGNGLLSHPALRAQQNRIPYVVPSGKELVRQYNGKNVTLRALGDNVVVQETPISSIKAPKRRVKINVPIVNLDASDIILPGQYAPDNVGPKAINLRIIDSLPGLKHQDKSKHLGLSYGLYEHVLANSKNSQLRRKIDNLLKKVRLKQPELADLRANIELLTIPAETLMAIREAIRKQIPEGTVFLRSMSNAEDLPGYDGAGLYDTFGGINPDDLKQLETYIKKVWASIWNDRAYDDRQANGIDHRMVHMAVLVQQTLDAQYSFVVNTEDPRHKGEMMMEIVEGMGESLASGNEEYIGNPHLFTYNRSDGRIRRVLFEDKDYRLISREGHFERVLTDPSTDIFFGNEGMELLKDVFEESIAIESGFHNGQKIEGCIIAPRQGVLEEVFVQSRNQQGRGDRALLVDQKQPVAGNNRLMNEDFRKGGIDLTSEKILSVKNNGQGIHFNIDPALLQELQDASGFRPVIINIHPLNNLQQFLGVGG